MHPPPSKAAKYRSGSHAAEKEEAGRDGDEDVNEKEKGRAPFLNLSPSERKAKVNDEGDFDAKRLYNQGATWRSSSPFAFRETSGMTQDNLHHIRCLRSARSWAEVSYTTTQCLRNLDRSRHYICLKVQLALFNS